MLCTAGSLYIFHKSYKVPLGNNWLVNVSQYIIKLRYCKNFTVASQKDQIVLLLVTGVAATRVQIGNICKDFSPRKVCVGNLIQ